MTKYELIETIAGKTNMPQAKVKTVIDTMIDVIYSEVKKGREVSVRKLGTWYATKVSKKFVDVPNIGVVEAPAYKKVSFRVAPSLKYFMRTKKAVKVNAKTKAKGKAKSKKR